MGFFSSGPSRKETQQFRDDTLRRERALTGQIDSEREAGNERFNQSYSALDSGARNLMNPDFRESMFGSGRSVGAGNYGDIQGVAGDLQGFRPTARLGNEAQPWLNEFARTGGMTDEQMNVRRDRLGNEAARPVEDLIRMAQRQGLANNSGGISFDSGIGEAMRMRNQQASDARTAGMIGLEDSRRAGREFGISGLANRDWQGAQVGMANDSTRMRGLEAAGGLYSNVMQDRTGREGLNAQLGADSDRLNLQAYLGGMGALEGMNSREMNNRNFLLSEQRGAYGLGQQGNSQIYQGQQNRPSMFSQLSQGLSQIGSAVSPWMSAFGAVTGGGRGSGGGGGGAANMSYTPSDASWSNMFGQPQQPRSYFGR